MIPRPNDIFVVSKLATSVSHFSQIPFDNQKNSFLPVLAFIKYIDWRVFVVFYKEVYTTIILAYCNVSVFFDSATCTIIFCLYRPDFQSRCANWKFPFQTPNSILPVFWVKTENHGSRYLLNAKFITWFNLWSYIILMILAKAILWFVFSWLCS